MIKSAYLMLLRAMAMPLFFLVAFEIFVLVALLLGGLPGDAAIIAYLCLAILTAPVWGGLLVLGIILIVDWSDKRARTKRIARAKAAKLAGAA